MPEIVVYALEGRSVEQKRGLMKDITQAMVKNFGVPADAVVITVVESEKAQQGQGRRAVLGNASTARCQGILTLRPAAVRPFRHCSAKNRAGSAKYRAFAMRVARNCPNGWRIKLRDEWRRRGMLEDRPIVRFVSKVATQSATAVLATLIGGYVLTALNLRSTSRPAKPQSQPRRMSAP